MPNYDEARKLFDSYRGDTNSMGREGDWGKYCSYNVPKKLESAWMEEYISKLENEWLLAKTNYNKWYIIFSYIRAIKIHKKQGAFDVFEIINNFKKDFDSLDYYTEKLLMNQLYDALEYNIRDKKNVVIECLDRLHFWENQEKLTVDDSYFTLPPKPIPKALLCEEELRKTLKRTIELWEQLKLKYDG